MDYNRSKYVGWEFINRLSETPENGSPVLEEFKTGSAEYRKDVALGLLAIGLDRSESLSKRNFAVATLASIARCCEFGETKDVSEQLSALAEKPVDDSEAPASNRSNSQVQRIQEAALIALVAVNPPAGFSKLDSLIRNHEDQRFVHRLREIRNILENGENSQSFPRF